MVVTPGTVSGDTYSAAAITCVGTMVMNKIHTNRRPGNIAHLPGRPWVAKRSSRMRDGHKRPAETLVANAGRTSLRPSIGVWARARPALPGLRASDSDLPAGSRALFWTERPAPLRWDRVPGSLGNARRSNGRIAMRALISLLYKINKKDQIRSFKAKGLPLKLSGSCRLGAS